jgi:ketosteroid isomerase-like protein
VADPVHVVRSFYDALAAGDGEAALNAFDPDVEWDGRNIPDGVLGRGREAVLDHAVHWASIWDDWTVEVEELTQVTPDTVIAYTRERGRSENGVVMDERHGEVYVVRNDKIVRRVGFSDPAEALPAVRAPSWTGTTPSA